MKTIKSRILLALVISVLLLLGIATPVLAGVEPSPFIPNQLYATTNQLYAIQAKLNAVFVPPDPCKPPPDDNYVGIVNMLGVTANQLVGIHDWIEGLRPPPDDNRVADALGSVKEAAQTIVGMRPPPDDGFPVDAFAGVTSSAQGIVDLVDGILETVLGPDI